MSNTEKKLAQLMGAMKVLTELEELTVEIEDSPKWLLHFMSSRRAQLISEAGICKKTLFTQLELAGQILTILSTKSNAGTPQAENHTILSTHGIFDSNS